MAPLDEEARRLAFGAAKRVSVVTAVSPRAAIDVFCVLITALGLVRKLALLYGGRPGTLGLITLMRHAVSHLALIGGMAASDWTMQFVSDMLGVPVDRPADLESTALGAAFAAGWQAGVYPGPDSFAERRRRDRVFTPAMDERTRDELYRGWREAVKRAL